MTTRKTVVQMPEWSTGQCQKTWKRKKGTRRCPNWDGLANGFCQEHWDGLWNKDYRNENQNPLGSIKNGTYIRNQKEG